MANVTGKSSEDGTPGVLGESEKFNGVLGITTANGHAGVAGVCDQGKSNGVYGRSKSANGVIGFSSADGSSGVAGANDEGNGFGVYGRSARAAGVQGESKEGNGVAGISTSGMGVYGKGGRLAGFFEGDVEVTGDIRLTNADCAEDFDIAETAIAEPGTVMVLNESGALQPSHHAYDKRVAGVVSGAGDYRPGIVLDKKDSDHPRKPVALLGKVFCKVDATQNSIEVGDLLTTSTIPGHAMKVIDSTKALGTIIGKALRPLREGQGLIPILIALQ
ncbi:MAG: hypothetical protein OJF51_001225 [Nitrospira sp.]|jgi:hypothetical protein|nr:MAG: hypothetical protein OJF51_001225 [Nitrospira sp.]